MVGQEAEVKVRIRQDGAEERKQRLLETKAALLGVSSGQPTVNNHITVQGSVLSDMELAKSMDKIFKDTLKRQGWT